MTSCLVKNILIALDCSTLFVFICHILTDLAQQGLSYQGLKIYDLIGIKIALN